MSEKRPKINAESSVKRNAGDGKKNASDGKRTMQRNASDRKLIFRNAGDGKMTCMKSD